MCISKGHFIYVKVTSFTWTPSKIEHTGLAAKSTFTRSRERDTLHKNESISYLGSAE